MKSRAKPIILSIVILVLIAVGIRFGIGFFSEKDITDESSWVTMDEERFSITVPKGMKEGKMLSMGLGDEKVLKFCTSTLAGFDVSVCDYNEEEKGTLGLLDAKAYAAAANLQKKTVGITEVKYEVREGKNYLYAEYPAKHTNYVSKSDDLWFIESMFPTKDGYFTVNTYCSRQDKDKIRDCMFKWLDSFTLK